MAKGGLGPVGVVVRSVVLSHGFSDQLRLEHLNRKEFGAVFAMEGLLERDLLGHASIG